jgi:uncharacterized protein
MRELKIVLHIDQGDRWPAALGNAGNVMRDHPDAKLRIIANGLAVYAFLGTSDLANRMAEQAAGGVEFQVCANALREHTVEPESLPPYARVVPSGVVAVAEAQADGFAYLKP